MAGVDGCAYCSAKNRRLTREYVKVLLNHPIGCDLSFHVNVCPPCKKKLAAEGIPKTRGSRVVLVA